MEADLPFLLRLRQDTMDAQLIAGGVDTTEAAHVSRILHCFECAELLLDEGLPVGLLKVRRRPGEWEILQIQLAPGLQGKGMGRSLLEEVIAEATAAHADLVLGVLKANPARQLYERLGFSVIAEEAQEFRMRRSRFEHRV